MPIYEYQCQNCGYLFEELQSMSEAQLITCPNCGKDELKKLIGTGGGIIFKGSGFYQTDYKKSAEPEKISDKGESMDKDKSPEKKETKTESGESKKETKQETGKEPKKESSSKPESKTDTKTDTKTVTKQDTKSNTKSETNNKK